MSAKDESSARDKEQAPSRDRASKKGKGKVIHSKERGIIRNVLRFCDQEATINALLYPLKKAQLRAAVATGVSPRTIVRIRKEAQANPPESRLKTPGKHRRKRKATLEDEDSSKKLKSEKPDSSDTSSSEDEKSDADLSTDSVDQLSDPEPEPEDPYFVKWPPTGEYVFKEVRAVDINFFVRCLRKVNSHHGTLSCNLNDMFMYEEASKNGVLGIIFRCRVCLMSIIVWTQDPTAKVPPLPPHATKPTVPQQKPRVKSSPTDFISPKMRNLSKFLGVKQSVQSNPPLIGCPQVAAVDQISALRGSGLNPPSKGVRPSSMKATVAELTFCVDQHESSPKPGSVSVESRDHSISSTTMPKSIDAPSQSSLKAKSAPWRPKTPAKLAPKKSITSDVVAQRPLKPRIPQPIGVRVSTLQPGIVKSSSIMTSSMQPLIQSNAIMTSTLQPRLNQSSGIMTSSLQPRLIQASGILPSTLQPRLIQASGMMASPMQPRILQTSDVRASPTGMANSPRIFIIQRPLRPQSFQSSGPETSSGTMVKPGQIIQTAQRPLQPMFVQPSGPGTSSTAMVKQEQIVLAPGAYPQRPLQPRIVQSGSLRISSTGMLKPERIIIGQDVFVQRPMMPRIVGSTPNKILILNDMFAQRPLLPGTAQSSGPRPIKSEEITITPDVFPLRILQSGNAPPRGIGASSTSIPPETIISDVSTQYNSRQSSTEILSVDLNLVKMEVEE